MPVDIDEKYLRDATARLVELAKHYPLSIRECLEYNLDTDLHDAFHIHALQAIQWAMVLREEARGAIRSILLRDPDRPSVQTVDENSPRVEP